MYNFDIFNTNNYFSDYARNKYDQLYKEIRKQDEDFIINIDETEYSTQLLKKYECNPITIHFDKGSMDPTDNTYYLPYEGNKELLKFRPENYSLTPTVFIKENCICFNIPYIDAESIKNYKEEQEKKIKKQYKNLEKEINDYNSSLPPKISNILKECKNEIINRRKDLKSLGIPLRNNKSQTYTVPLFKKDTPSPLKYKLSKNKLEPIVSQEDYNTILEIIYNKGREFERLHSTYNNKNEKELRDEIISTLSPLLNESVTAETYNKKGKTDILIRHENTNIFIAECKIWRGIKSYCAAIDQLLSYLTWRDTKTALIIFVYKKEIKQILKKIKTQTQNHKNCIEEHEPSAESWFNYTFHLNSDENCKIKLAVLIFYIPPPD